MTTAVLTENLTKRFGDFVAVDHLSFELEAGQVMGYLGPNGSGKTTTIRMLLGLLHPSEGRAEVLGYDVATQSDPIRARAGYMSQKFALYGELTTRENLEFYGRVYGVKDRQRIDQILGDLGLNDVMNQRVQNLSAGWRQRISLATAIVHQPGLLLLDEPTSGVDPVARRAFWDLIYSLSERGITVMVSTHYMDEAEYCSVVGIMRNGKLLALDEPGRLKQSLPGGVWLVFAEPLLPALEALESIQGVMWASLASDHLRVVAEEAVDAKRLTDGLRSAGIETKSIQQGEPTMEDVFTMLSR